MSRSAEAATRFTSTTPHAHGKIPPSAVNLSAKSAKAAPPLLSKNPGPGGETPQQKVARLKAAAAKGRASNVSSVDKMLLRGRVWADRAHRFTALSLIGITGIAGVVTVYALGDMVIYNRRKKAEYFAEQRALQSAALFEAQKAIRDGRATEEQQVMVEEEFKYMQAEEKKKSKKGMFARGKEWLFSGLKKDEVEGEGGEAAKGVFERDDTSLSEEDETMGERQSDVLRAIEDKKNAVTDSAKRAFEKERELQRSGGPLDRIGAPALESSGAEEKKSGGGWTSFMSRR